MRRKGGMRQLQGWTRRANISVMKYSTLILVATAVSLSGCGMLDRMTKPAAPPVQAAVPLPAALEPMGAGQSVEALDKTTAAEKAAAIDVPQAGGERELGRQVVGLGSPAEQGFWVKSNLIAAAGKGRVAIAGGKSVAVDLIPGTGGALLSLAAYRALGLGLTDLPDVTIYAN